ncbi:MAG: cytochrome-c oxidase [Planifilum sp.]|jgi:cbb3-type cytochrome oxidase subunit 1
MAIRFIKVAVFYFVVGVGLGIHMGITDQFSFTSAHAHINLLGWVSLALAGLIYHAFPQAGKSRLAVVHYWLKMIGVPLLFIAMGLFGMGKVGPAVPLSAAGGVIVLTGTILFTMNIMKNLQPNG